MEAGRKIMVKTYKVFGAALDPSDSETKILIKHGVLESKLMGRKISGQYEDPYEAFIAESKILQKPNFQNIGRFPVESWLRPKPELGDEVFLTPLDFRLFLDSDGCREYAERLAGFVEKQVFPATPLMIGTDHSLTGGVLRALVKKYGAENITLVVFDGHFDAIPTDLRLGLVKYAKEHKDDVVIPFPEMIDSIGTHETIPRSYNCGTFLYHLIEERVVFPHNVIVYGVMDYPSDEMRKVEDPRVRSYVTFYSALENQGMQIIPNYKDNEKTNQEFQKALERLETPFLYLSVDVDVSALNAVLAARFMEFIGIDASALLLAGHIIKEWMDKTKVDLIGLDLMEIEVHFLNADLKKSGKTDQTIALMDEFLFKIGL
ncbi:MAG: hypothetical protein EU536_02745 [Promethearchaeota archaeon]|nr:MAG: hypothetical protein EU536_02745 [Candidatus Lokiarchaeota archaeon]